MKLILGDCIEKLKELKENSVDAIVTDPPAGISFMGKEWDKDKGGRDNWIKWMSDVAKECLRVLKPGGHAFVWALPRTSHWTATAWENAGFEIRDVVAHIFGSGFPKSLNVGLAVAKLKNEKLKEVGDNPNHRKSDALYKLGFQGGKGNGKIKQAQNEFSGWGTALKPAREDWILMRKPLAEKSVAENVLKWKTGGINIDESRVGTDIIQSVGTKGKQKFQVGNNNPVEVLGEHMGRFPANLCWSCDCDNNYLTGNALFDILSNISNQIKLCQLNNSNSNALNVEQKKHQQDTTSEEKKLCFAVENVDTLFLEKILGKTLEVIFSVNTECSAEMLEESMNTSLSISLSGNEKMEEYQKVLKFITLTATRLITELKTCNLSQSQIIGSFITKVISGIREQSQVKSHSPECWVRECFPYTKAGVAVRRNGNNANGIFPVKISEGSADVGFNDSGNASRFFKSIIYQAKASKSERNKGCEGLEEKQTGHGNLQNSEGFERFDTKNQNNHPTVKPVALMEYLIKMITPKCGIVLDPFMGSGSTGIACKKNGFDFIGIEKEEPYYVIACARIKSAKVNLAELIKKI
jgi:DNA modification methylase